MHSGAGLSLGDSCPAAVSLTPSTRVHSSPACFAPGSVFEYVADEADAHSAVEKRCLSVRHVTAVGDADLNRVDESLLVQPQAVVVVCAVAHFADACVADELMNVHERQVMLMIAPLG